MKRYLTHEQFEALRPRIDEGSVTLSVSKSVARQFFLRVADRSIRDTTGKSMLPQKLAVWMGLAASAVTLLAALAFIVVDYGWSAAITAPLVGIFWTVLAGFTSDRGNWIHGAIGLVLALGLAWAIPASFAIPLALVATSLFVLRVTYALAQYWVIHLVGHSFSAYDMLVEHIDIDGIETDDSVGAT